MNRIPVQSSSIASVGYDSATATLEIEFQGGRVYDYFDVPAAEAEALLAATSVGTYFNTNIRDRYRYAAL